LPVSRATPKLASVLNDSHPIARVAFAGLSPLCERILRGALSQREDVDLVEPWTRLASVNASNSAGTPEILFLELDRHQLTPPLRAMLATAAGLRIIALSPDGREATVFALHEQRSILQERSADEICDLFDLRP
jgi:hypothetical protein